MKTRAEFLALSAVDTSILDNLNESGNYHATIINLVSDATTSSIAEIRKHIETIMGGEPQEYGFLCDLERGLTVREAALSLADADTPQAIISSLSQDDLNEFHELFSIDSPKVVAATIVEKASNRQLAEVTRKLSLMGSILGAPSPLLTNITESARQRREETLPSASSLISGLSVFNSAPSVVHNEISKDAQTDSSKPSFFS